MKYVLVTLLTFISAQALAIDVTNEGLTAHPWCEKWVDTDMSILNEVTFGNDGKFTQVVTELAADGSLGEVLIQNESVWVLNGQAIVLSDPADPTLNDTINAAMMEMDGTHLILSDPTTNDQIADLMACK